MQYNKFTLAFPEHEEKLFLKTYFTDSLFQMRFALVMVTFLYGIFGYLDSVMFPEHAKLFHVIRYVFVVPLFSAVFFLSFTRVFRKIWQILLLICTIAGAFGISIMIMLVPDNYVYSAGMMLVFSAGYFFIKLRFFLASIAGWLSLLIYNILVISCSQCSAFMIVNTNFFFVSANIIGMFAAYNIEYYARRSFYLNLELDKEKLLVDYVNTNLEKTVELRTNELLFAKETAELNNANVTAIIEGNQNSIWAFNRNYEVLYINQVFQSEFQETFGEWLEPGVNLIESLPAAIRPIWKPRYDRVLNNEQFTVDDEIQTGNGLLYIQVSFNPIVKQGEVVGGSCFGSNITDRKIAEINLQKAKEQAEESDRLKSAFLANMSHEIRTPMNGILGFSDLLKNPALSSERQQMYLRLIEKSGARMLNIINDIMDISKIEAGLMKPDLGVSNINEQMYDLYAFFKPEADTKGINLTYQVYLSLNEANVYTDKEKVYAILTNLIRNAIKFTEQGSIDFGYILKGSNFEFYVKDTGIGIPDDRQQAIFERFIQADIADKAARQGAGLGLSISKAYIEMLGGKIWVESTEGVGSTFHFTLPANSASLSTATQVNVPLQMIENNHGHAIAGIKTLIAEDDDTSVMLLEIIAQKFSREVFIARNGFEVVEACRSNPDFDLILMDIQMPGMNGYEATKQIRKMNSTVVIIAQTAFGLSGDREKSIEAGCNDYIVKPINETELLLLVKKYFKV